MSPKLIILLHLLIIVFYSYQEYALFNFNVDNDISKWTESSDTLNTKGRSKGAIVIQRSAEAQRAIFFSLINPNLRGGGFAGVKTDVSWNLRNYDGFALSVRGQGENFGYKIVLRDNNSRLLYTFEQFFEVPAITFRTVYLPFKQFKPYSRGRPVNVNAPINKNYIISFGVQMYGGAYLPFKQKGVSSLEINSINVYP